MKYNVTYQETSVIEVQIEANSEDEAEEIFDRMAEERQVDFTHMDVIDSGLYITKAQVTIGKEIKHHEKTYCKIDSVGTARTYDWRIHVLSPDNVGL